MMNFSLPFWHKTSFMSRSFVKTNITVSTKILSPEQSTDVTFHRLSLLPFRAYRIFRCLSSFPFRNHLTIQITGTGLIISTY
jgi:hypothetical protein